MLKLDSNIKFQNCVWKVGAILLTGGERYYMLVNCKDNKDIAMIPAFMLETED